MRAEHIESVDRLLKAEQQYKPSEQADPESDEESELEEVMTPDKVWKIGIPIGTVLVAALVGFGIYGLARHLTKTPRKISASQSSALERYAALPTTNVTAQTGDTMDRLIYRFAGDFNAPLSAMRYEFMKDNGNNGQISSNKTYNVRINTNSHTRADNTQTNAF